MKSTEADLSRKAAKLTDRPAIVRWVMEGAKPETLEEAVAQAETESDLDFTAKADLIRELI